MLSMEESNLRNSALKELIKCDNSRAASGDKGSRGGQGCSGRASASSTKVTGFESRYELKACFDIDVK